VIINDMSYEWLTWGVSRVPAGDLPPDALARIDVDRQRAVALPLVLRAIPIHWTIDRSVNERFTGHASRLRPAWRRFAELRFNEQHIYIEAFGGIGSGPGFGFKDVRIYLDGAIVGRAWRGGCSLGFGGGVGPAVAMLPDGRALRVAPELQVDQSWGDWQLLVLTRPEDHNATIDAPFSASHPLRRLWSGMARSTRRQNAGVWFRSRR
jgi:hypothetical protein